MADIRIKDLATLESASLTGDVFVIDGTTGTRKLSAFSPSFGGNATVTGTLTVNGTTAFVGANTGSPYVLIKGGSSGTNGGGSLVVENGSGGSVIGIGNVSAIAGGAYNNDPVVWYAGSESLRFYNASTEVANFSSTGVLSLLSTTASTSTSTGALVVGNGTSGGLGVGGAIFAGQSVSVVQSLADNNGFRVINTNTAGLPGLYIEGDGGEYALIRRQNSTAGSPRRLEYIATGSGANHYFNTNTIVGATTASTSTSSGALVVSGGVGVAGAIYGGGDIISSGNGNIQGGRFTSVNSNSYIEQSGTDFTYVTGGSRPHVFSIGGTTRFQVTTSGIISSLPASAASLTVNSTMTFELTSNTSLKIFVRGSDGTTRSTTLTLA